MLLSIAHFAYLKLHSSTLHSNKKTLKYFKIFYLKCIFTCPLIFASCYFIYQQINNLMSLRKYGNIFFSSSSACPEGTVRNLRLQDCMLALSNFLQLPASPSARVTKMPALLFATGRTHIRTKSRKLLSFNLF